MNYVIAQARRDDFSGLGEIMYKAVRQGSSPYTQTQRQAWMPRPRQGAEWNERLAAQYVLKAEADAAPRDEALIGFMSLRPDGYVDFAYILPEARGQGLFRTLFAAIENEAVARGLEQLTTHASLMAQPAFKAVGFETAGKETVEIDSVKLDRFEMSKNLRAG